MLTENAQRALININSVYFRILMGKKLGIVWQRGGGKGSWTDTTEPGPAAASTGVTMATDAALTQFSVHWWTGHKVPEA